MSLVPCRRERVYTTRELPAIARGRMNRYPLDRRSGSRGLARLFRGLLPPVAAVSRAFVPARIALLCRLATAEGIIAFWRPL